MSEEEVKSAAEAEEKNAEQPAAAIIDAAKVEEKVEAPAEQAVTVKQKPVKNTMESIEKNLLESQNNFNKLADFNVGDTVKVYVKIVEGDKQRVQPYIGVVIAIKHGGNRKTFTVRRISYNVAIERVFPYHSPFIEKIEIVRKGRVRRSKLYYLRGRFGRSAVVSEKVSS